MKDFPGSLLPECCQQVPDFFIAATPRCSAVDGGAGWPRAAGAWLRMKSDYATTVDALLVDLRRHLLQAYESCGDGVRSVATGDSPVDTIRSAASSLTGFPVPQGVLQARAEVRLPVQHTISAVSACRLVELS
eukprot:Skav206615  [mRNA]  locus=scaffold1562:95671:101157:+ [translate_table: standard]